MDVCLRSKRFRYNILLSPYAHCSLLQLFFFEWALKGYQKKHLFTGFVFFWALGFFIFKHLAFRSDPGPCWLEFRNTCRLTKLVWHWANTEALLTHTPQNLFRIVHGSKMTNLSTCFLHENSLMTLQYVYCPWWHLFKSMPSGLDVSLAFWRYVYQSNTFKAKWLKTLGSVYLYYDLSLNQNKHTIIHMIRRWIFTCSTIRFFFSETSPRFLILQHLNFGRES